MTDPEMERVEKIIRLEANMRDRQRSGMWGDPDPLRYFVVEYDRRGSERDEALSLLRELVDIYRRSNGSVEELYEAMGRAYALVERVSPGDET